MGTVGAKTISLAYTWEPISQGLRIYTTKRFSDLKASLLPFCVGVWLGGSLRELCLLGLENRRMNSLLVLIVYPSLPVDFMCMT